jgi:hypothetical protein
LVFFGCRTKAPDFYEKEILMSTIGSLITIASVLAIIFVPQMLVLYFSQWRKSEREEYIPDGR